MQFAAVVSSAIRLLLFRVAADPARGLLVDARNSLPSTQLREHVGRFQAVVRERDEAVEPQVCHLGDDLPAVAGLPGHYRLSRLLADLLQYCVLAVREQPRDIGPLRVAALAALNRLRQPVEDVAHLR